MRRFYAGGRRIAARQGLLGVAGVVQYLYGDHADRRFTGQIDDAAIGLYFYNARYYDHALGRFLSADTIVPDPSTPVDLNRYAYARNNPVRYSDPTGHYVFEEDYYGDPTAHSYEVPRELQDGNGRLGSYLFLGPGDAESLYGVSTPMRIPLSHFTDPEGWGKLIGMGYLFTLLGVGDSMAQGRPAVHGPLTRSSKEPYGNHYPEGSPAQSEQVGVTEDEIHPMSLEQALKSLNESGLRPGQTVISRGRVMEIADSFNPAKATSSVYRTSNGARYLVEGHHTTVAAEMLQRSGPFMGQPTNQMPSAMNVYWIKQPWEFWKAAIQILP